MTIQAKLIALLVLIGLAFGIHWHGVNQGKRMERSEWQAKEIRRITAEQKATLQAIENNTRIEQQQEIDKRKVINGYQTEIASIRATHERVAGRLRISSAICNSAAATGQADGASRTDAAAAGTVELPIETERDLRRLARDADEVTATARALQEWARLNGMSKE